MPIRFALEESFDLSAFVDSCQLTLTGADFYALCSDAMLRAMKRRIGEYETGIHYTGVWSSHDTI